MSKQLWGLNKNNSSRGNINEKSMSAESNFSIHSDFNFNSNLNNNVRKLKFYDEYSDIEKENYVEIIDSLEPESIERMVIKTIDLGIPTSFISGYFDVDISILSRINLEWEDELIVKNNIVRNYIKNSVLLLSGDANDFNKLNEKFIISNITIIRDTEQLIDVLEQETEEVTIWITSNLSEDLKLSMDLLTEHLDLDGVYFVEIGTDKYFDKAVYFNDWSELNTEDMLERDTNLEEIEDKLDDFSDESIIEVSDNIIEEDDIKENVIPSKNNNNINIDSTSDSNFTNDKLKEEMELLSKELGNYKLLYAKKLEEVSILTGEVKKLEDELFKMENEVSSNINQKGYLIGLEKKLKESELLLNSLGLQNKRLEEDLNNLRHGYAELEISYLANQELLQEKTKSYNKLNIEHENLNKEFNKLQEEIDNLISELPDPNLLSELEERIINKDAEIRELGEVNKQLRIDIRKVEETKRLNDNELDELKLSYKELLSKGKISTDTIDVKNLTDDINTHIFYFKVLTQPPYFKSFMEGLKSLLSKDNKVLTVLIKDEDELSEHYFGHLKKVNLLEEVLTSDNDIWLKPSKLMFTDDNSFYNKYDYIVVIDYVKTTQRFIRGSQVTYVNVLMNEHEKELLGIKGMVLSGGEQSIVDMRYDKKYEFAKTSFVRKRYMQTKIKEWLNSIGII